MPSKVKNLFDAFNHALLHWTSEISKNLETTSHRQLELYIQQALEAAINKTLYNRRIGSVGMAQRGLDSVKGIFNSAKSSLNPDTQYICARYLLTKGALHMDEAAYQSSILAHIDALRCLAQEQTTRCTSQLTLLKSMNVSKSKYKIRRNVRKVLS